MTRTSIINDLSSLIQAERFLEIGVNDGINFSSINVKYKIGVDPSESSKATNKVTSDDFFQHNREKFDVIFVDGLHENEQCYVDIINSLEVLNDGGFIICHDMKPLNYYAQLVPRMQSLWNGDVWKAWVRLRQNRSDLSMFVIDTDHGCGVIYKGSQELLPKDIDVTYENFVNNEKNWLNLKTKAQFLQFLTDKQCLIK